MERIRRFLGTHRHLVEKTVYVDLYEGFGKASGATTW